MTAPRPLVAALACVAVGAAATPAAGASLAESLSCIAPTDAAGIDAALARAASPLAGEGTTFVQVGEREGVDPRFLVAVAAHETLLATYGPARLIHNPFGIGPGWAFASERVAIAAAGRILRRYYLAEGIATVDAIGRKWAPVGALNDPTDLNRHWEGGVATYYAALGGDPARPVTLIAQDPTPQCGAAAGGTPMVTAWDGRTPAAGPGLYEGGDPATGLPASIPAFVFPVAVPAGTPVRYADDFDAPGSPGCFGRRWACAVTLAAPGADVVAVAAGTLRGATADERLQGVGFWLETGAGDRIGYGPLRDYRPGVADGAPVLPGQALGHAPGLLLVAWERGGVRVNPFPLLAATRPPG
ncbi:MAG: glucosaminidase domain-containing protein [Actinomycetota bacterium]